MTLWVALSYSVNVFIHSVVYIYFVTYPFKKSFRFSPFVSNVLIGLYIGLVTILDLLFSEEGAPFAEYQMVSLVFWVLLSLVFSLTMIKGSPVKLIFSFVVAHTIQYNQISLAKMMDAKQALPVLSAELPYLNYLLYCLFTLAVAVPFLWYLFCRLLKQVEDTQLDFTQWKFVFILPLSFYLYCIITTMSRRANGREIDIYTIMIFICINIFAYSSYLIILRMLLNINKKLLVQHKVEIMEKQHAREKEYYKQLLNSSQQTKRLRHDWKQHLFALKGYLDQGRYEELILHLNAYVRQVETEDQTVFCKQETINILLRYYAAAAKEKCIIFDVDIPPFDLQNLSEPDFCIILGNLIENAVQACGENDPEKFIRISMKLFGTSLAIQIENSFYGTLLTKGDAYLSTKHSGSAIGIASVKNIVGQNDGILKIKHENHVFNVVVLVRV